MYNNVLAWYSMHVQCARLSAALAQAHFSFVARGKREKKKRLHLRLSLLPFYFSLLFFSPYLFLNLIYNFSKRKIVTGRFMSPDQLYRSRHADVYAGRRESLSATGVRGGDGRGRVEEDEEASSILISLANQTPAPLSTTTSTSNTPLPLSGIHSSQASSTSTAVNI